MMCFIFGHKWDKWSDPVLDRTVGVFSYPIRRQTRYCKRCNRAQEIIV